MNKHEKVWIKNPSSFEMDVQNTAVKRAFFVPTELANPHLSDIRWIELAKAKGVIKAASPKTIDGHEKRTIKVWKTFRSGTETIENLVYKGGKHV